MNVADGCSLHDCAYHVHSGLHSNVKSEPELLWGSGRLELIVKLLRQRTGNKSANDISDRESAYTRRRPMRRRMPGRILIKGDHMAQTYRALQA